MFVVVWLFFSAKLNSLDDSTLFAQQNAGEGEAYIAESFTRRGKTTFESHGAIKYALRRGVISYGDKQVPFAIEAAAFPSNKQFTEIVECINFTASLYGPFTRYAFPFENEKLTTLYDLVKNTGNLTILIHLVSPNLTWLSPSKGEMAELKHLRKSLLALTKRVSKIDTVKIDNVEIITLVRHILRKYEEQFFTLRQIFYRLVALCGFLNTRNMYSYLSKILREAREGRLIDVERIIDLTRPEYYNNPEYKTLDEYA